MLGLSLVFFLTLLTGISLGSAFRDNDQAALISGCIQMLRGQMSPWHAAFYNYDKQWGSYLLLAGMSLLTPGVDPVLRGNVLQTALLLPAMALSIFAVTRKRHVPVWTFLPLFLSPALVLYMPFLATASLSLAFLFLSFFLIRTGRKRLAIIALAAAAACRGDVVLIAPVIILSSMPRMSLVRLIRCPFAWLVSAATIAPVLFGKLISGIRFADLAGFSFSLPLFAGFVTFALGIGVLVLLAAGVATRVAAIVSRREWRFFYALELLALLIPIAFYWAQLYSPRYFFLTLIALLFFATSRRTAVMVSPLPRVFPWAAILLTVVPWTVGLAMPSLDHLRPTLTAPTEFPTADGAFPMGAYAAFAILAAGRDHLNIDHNQRTWAAARTIDYRVCNGFVPVMATPMSYYLDLAIRLQNKTPARIVDIANAKVGGVSCGGAYVDLRAVIRHDSQGMDVARTDITIVSQKPELGRPIAWMAYNREPSPAADTFRELEHYLRGRDAEVFLDLQNPKPAAGVHTVFLSDSENCSTALPGTRHLCAQFAPAESGYARTVFPDYMNK